MYDTSTVKTTFLQTLINEGEVKKVENGEIEGIQLDVPLCEIPEIAAWKVKVVPVAATEVRAERRCDVDVDVRNELTRRTQNRTRERSTDSSLTAGRSLFKVRRLTVIAVWIGKI